MSDSLTDSKDVLLERSRQSLQRELSDSCRWAPREKVALACRILCSHGHESGLAGQITTRGPGSTFITQRLGIGMSETRASNLLGVDEDLRVIDGAGMANPANRFHVWVYQARPDIRCLVHTHPPYTSALSMLGLPLTIAHMDSCGLYDNVAFLDHWPGVPVGNEEGQQISAALGDKAALLLAHHGLLVAGRTLEEACVLALQFERAAFLQMTALGVGPIRAMDRELGLEARGWLLTPARLEATFAYHARRVLVSDPQCIT
jgi:L-fuculose-phosphate aldolase